MKRKWRSLLIGALIALQLFALMAAIWFLNLQAAYLYSALEAISVVLVLFLVSSRDNPSYKMTWIIIILIFPIFGVLLYFIAGTHYLSPGLRKKIRQSRRIGRQYRFQSPKVLDALRRESPAYARQAAYVLRAGDKPVYDGASARLMTSGESLLRAMLEALEQAERFIFLEYFIISDGWMWSRIFDVLQRKAKQGVEVRLIYDDAGSLDGLPRALRRMLSESGIRVARFNPFVPVLNKFMNYRDHRKITVIDGKVGYTGGINIADEYIGRKILYGKWKDTGIEVRGDAVWSFTLMFLDMWTMVTGETLPGERYHPAFAQPGGGYIQPFEDSPLHNTNVAEYAYMQMIGGATKYITITTPYLVPDHELVEALCNTARSGVEVRIVTPHVPDKWYVYAVTRANYQQLMDAGVKIYEYLPGFIHSKMALCDDVAGIVGSINLDYRSFYLQFECAVWLYGGEIIREMREEIGEILGASKLIDPEQWRRRPFARKLLGSVMRLLAPLM
jgi:cardiolipin synthase